MKRSGIKALARPLRPAQRNAVERQMRSLLGWQRDLLRWPRPGKAPDAMPFVSLYAKGRLCGCFGSDEGSPGERLTRAFLRALSDLRFGGVASHERASIAAQVAYPHKIASVSADAALARIEAGTHGVAMSAGASLVVLLPQAARDDAFGPEAMLRALAVKAGLSPDAWRERELFLFETHDIVVRDPSSDRKQSALATAVAWLEGLIDARGAIGFAIDGRRRQQHATGLMYHGRAAMVLRALSMARAAPRKLARARARLHRDIASSLAGRLAPGWPDHPAMVAGTLALACLAGVPLERELTDLLGARPEIADHAWHAAQISLALGPHTPAPIWRACVKDLERRPWAPWTTMAARARQDPVLAACERTLVGSIATRAPHAGGATVTTVPEIAQTAVVVEALAGSSSPSARRAVARAREFLLRWQLLPARIPAALDPTLVAGAFPISPIVDVARCDVTAHAVMALL